MDLDPQDYKLYIYWKY